MIRRLIVLILLAHVTVLVAVFDEANWGTPALAQGAGTLTVQDPVSVVSNSYERSGGFAYDTMVVFWVTNPNSTQAAVNVPYRVTIEGSGSVLYISDGRDTVTVYPMET